MQTAAPRAVDIDRRRAGKILVAKLSDHRVDARLAGDFERSLCALVDSGHALIALDLSEVDFLDSRGLRAIVAALKQLQGRGDLVIVGARPSVLDLFRLTRMDKVFQMFPRADDAVAALSN